MNNIYGCDICQEVCPWNKRAKLTDLKVFNPKQEFTIPDLIELLRNVENNWNKLKIKSPVKRVKKDGLIRNILIVMGNIGDIEYIPILEEYIINKNLISAKTAEDSIQRIKDSLDS